MGLKRNNYILTALNNKGREQLKRVNYKDHKRNMLDDSAKAYNQILIKEGLQYVLVVNEEKHIDKLFDNLFMSKK